MSRPATGGRRLHEMSPEERIAWADEQAVMALEEKLRKAMPMRLWLLWLRLLRALDRLRELGRRWP